MTALEQAPDTTPISEAANRQNLLLLTQLRWIAAGGQVATILLVHLGLGIALPLGWMFSVILLLMALNFISLRRIESARRIGNGELFGQLLLDVAALTAQLYLSGGAANPFVTLFLLHIILSAVLLEAWSAWAMVVVTSLCFVLLMRYALPLALPAGHDGVVGLHLQGMLICFVLAGGLLVFFVNKINRNLRLRDARLAEMRRQSIEEEHIVRMGLLASGAAHELGTPLSTISVILGDWRRLPALASDPALVADLSDMQSEVGRCKAIVSGILVSAGEARGEGTERTTVRAFFHGLVAEWRALHPQIDVKLAGTFEPDEPILSDAALRQVVASLLDNALEAGAATIRVEAARVSDQLVLTVTDDGSGFPPHILEEFGKPYRSSKAQPGRGLGLFLVVNVVRKLGGQVSAANRAGGGAILTLKLPLARIMAAG